MALSYSFHISNSKNAINTSMQLSKRLQHNLRSYSQQKLNEKSYNREKNFVLLGPDNATKAFAKFKEFYSETFDDAVKEYNATKKKNRDKIENYFNHISNSKKSELATEIIIQVGDVDFWKTKTYEEQKKMNKIFQSQIKKLQNELPNFKILSVAVHYDEASPHLQILGVPIAYYKKGLKVRTTKSKVFSRESLESLQAQMRKDIEKQMQLIYGKDINLKAKEKGRNYDYTCTEYAKQAEEDKKKAAKAKEEKEKAEKERVQEEQARDKIRADISELLIYKDNLDENIKQKKKVLSSTIPENTIYNNIIKIKNLKKTNYIGKVGILNDKQSFYKASDIDDFLDTIQENSVNLYNQKKKINEQEQDINAIKDENLKLKDDSRILDILQNTIFKNLITKARELFENNVYYYAEELFKKILKEKEFIKDDTSKWKNRNRDDDFEK